MGQPYHGPEQSNPAFEMYFVWYASKKRGSEFEVPKEVAKGLEAIEGIEILTNIVKEFPAIAVRVPPGIRNKLESIEGVQKVVLSPLNL